MVGKAIPIHNATLHPPEAYAHPPTKDPTAPPKKKIVMNNPFKRLRTSGCKEKIKRWLKTGRGISHSIFPAPSTASKATSREGNSKRRIQRKTWYWIIHRSHLWTIFYRLLVAGDKLDDSYVHHLVTSAFDGIRLKWITFEKRIKCALLLY